MDFCELQSCVNANGMRRLPENASFHFAMNRITWQDADRLLIERRQREVEGAALADGAVHTHLAAHLFDNHPHDG